AELARGDAPLDAVDRRERNVNPAEPARRNGSLERGALVEPQAAVRRGRIAREEPAVLAQHGELRARHPADLAVEPLEFRRRDADPHHAGERALRRRPAPAYREERIGREARIAGNQNLADVRPGVPLDLSPEIIAVRGAQLPQPRLEHGGQQRTAVALGPTGAV